MIRAVAIVALLLGAAGCPPLASTANVPQPWPAQDPAVKATTTPAPAPAPVAPTP